MQSITVNSATGETTYRDLTPAEIAAMTPDPAIALAQWRAMAQCTQTQGILALGEVEWGKVLAYGATATWAERVIVESAGNWHRNSENIQFFGYLLGMTDDEIDAKFRTAMGIVP